MNRRQFLALSTLAVTTSPILANAGQTVEFSQDAYQTALESGEPFMLDFTASW